MAEKTGNQKKAPIPHIKYSKELVDYICEKLAVSEKGFFALHKAEPSKIPAASTLYRWLDDHEYFRNSYARAKQQQATFIFEQIIDIADDTSRDTVIVKTPGGIQEKPNNEWIARSKLRCEMRQWVAGRLAPRMYGKPSEEIDGDDKKMTIKIIRDEPSNLSGNEKTMD